MGDQIVEKTAMSVFLRTPEPTDMTSNVPPSSADEETKKLQAPKTLEQLSKEAVQKLKAPDVPEQVRRVSGIVATIHARRELRARIIAEIKRLEVVHERVEREGQSALDAKISAVRAECERQVAELKSRFHMEHDLRLGEESTCQADLEKVDLSLEQLRKQLDAELGKLDPDRKVPA